MNFSILQFFYKCFVENGVDFEHFKTVHFENEIIEILNLKQTLISEMVHLKQEEFEYKTNQNEEFLSSSSMLTFYKILKIEIPMKSFELFIGPAFSHLKMVIPKYEVQMFQGFIIHQKFNNKLIFSILLPRNYNIILKYIFSFYLMFFLKNQVIVDK